MPTRPLRPDELEELRQLARGLGKIVAQRAFADGPPLDLDFDALEDIAVAAAQGLTAGTLEQLLQRQTQPLQHADCPTCQRTCPVTHQPRLLTVRGGACHYDEPVAHCPACRRDFFPAASLPASE